MQPAVFWSDIQPSENADSFWYDAVLISGTTKRYVTSGWWHLLLIPPDMVTIARDYVAALCTAVEEEDRSNLIGTFDFGSAGLRFGVSLNFSVPDATA